MARIKIGDIFKIETSKGIAYLHYVNKDKTIGDLINVNSKLFFEEQTNLEEIVDDVSFSIFFPLSFANKQGIVTKVGHVKLKKEFTKPSFMRSEHYIGDDFLGWHIVNTDTWERQFVEKLTEEQKKLSPWGLWNDTLLKERLENNWQLNKWE